MDICVLSSTSQLCHQADSEFRMEASPPLPPTPLKFLLSGISISIEGGSWCLPSFRRFIHKIFKNLSLLEIEVCYKVTFTRLYVNGLLGAAAPKEDATGPLSSLTQWSACQRQSHTYAASGLVFSFQSFSCCLKAPGSPWCLAAYICTCRPKQGTQCGL